MQIKWKELLKFQRGILMMGIFHLDVVFLNILNKRFGDTGLRDALLQSSIVAEGSADSALRWKSYNRSLIKMKVFDSTKFIMKHLIAFSSNNWKTRHLKCIKNFQVMLIKQTRWMQPDSRPWNRNKFRTALQQLFVDMRSLFKYPLLPLPLTLAEMDGTLKKTAKSVLLNKLERGMVTIEGLQSNYCMIIDGMVAMR